MTPIQRLCAIFAAISCHITSGSAYAGPYPNGVPIVVDLVAGTWDDWTVWSPCSVTCGVGERTRTRACVYPGGAIGGQPCEGQSEGAGVETGACEVVNCPVVATTAILDAQTGSTVLRIFRYDINASDSNLFSNVREEATNKVYPGLHQFKNGLNYKGTTVREYLEPLMDKLREIMNHFHGESTGDSESHYREHTHEQTGEHTDEHSNEHTDEQTSEHTHEHTFEHTHEYTGKHTHEHETIYLLATGEMRLLPVEESEPLMEEVRSLLQNSTFNVIPYSGPQTVRVISGEEQAAYSWVALNFLAGNLRSDQDANLSLHKSYGVFVMGTESTQIAFVPEEPIKAGEFTVTLGGVKYELYVHSYEQYGLGGMIDLMAEDLEVMSFNYTDTDYPYLANPCFVVGFKQARRLVNGSKVVHVGTGNPMQCEQLIQSHLYTDIAIEREMNLCTEYVCRVRNVYQPELPADMTFYATQGFEHTAHDLDWKTEYGEHVDLDILDKYNRLNSINLKVEGFRYCGLNKTEALQNYPAVEERYAGKRCMGALYTSSLLAAYGVHEHGIDIVAQSKIHKQNIDWPLGATLVTAYERLSGVKVMGSYGYSAAQQTNYVHPAHDERYGPAFAYGYKN